MLAISAEDPTTHPNPLPLSVIRPDHPRIWFNTDNVDLLKQRWKDPSYADIVSKYRGKSDPLSLALEGLATGDAAKCSQAASTVKTTYSPSGDPEAGFVDPVSLVFDWCYNSIDSGQRAYLISRIRFLRDQQKDHPATGIRSRFLWHETFLVSSYAYIANVLAIEGEPGVDSELRLAQNVLQNIQEIGDEISGDGGYTDYFYQGNIQTLPFFMWDSATDFDFAERSSFTRNFTAWSTYKLAPTGRGFLRGPGDDDALESGFTRDVLSAAGFYLIASHSGDPVAQWLGNHLRQQFDQEFQWQYEGPSFISLVHFDPNRQAMTPSQAGMPTSAYFETVGMVHMRSSWTTGSDVAHIWFYNGPAGGHTGANQNHFTIWRGNAPLIMQGGNYLGYPSKYHSHYYWPTISDNCLLFSPEDSENPDHAGGQGVGAENSLESLQRFPASARVATSNKPAYRGEIVNYSDTDDYTVVSGDATVAYDADRVASYVRDFVYLKPDIILIRDRFDVQDVATIRSLIHSRTKPIVEGAFAIVEGSLNAGVLESSSGRFRIQNRLSEATVNVLWPSDTTLRLVGGAGYEAYADGYNSDPLTDSQEWLRDHWELAERIKLIDGQWRTEIETSPARAQGNVVFAVFISEADPEERPVFSVVTVGSEIRVTVSWNRKTQVVAFSKGAAPRVGSADRREPSIRRVAPAGR